MRSPCFDAKHAEREKQNARAVLACKWVQLPRLNNSAQTGKKPPSRCTGGAASENLPSLSTVPSAAEKMRSAWFAIWSEEKISGPMKVHWARPILGGCCTLKKMMLAHKCTPLASHSAEIERVINKMHLSIAFEQIVSNFT
jgi:hypothetical protein